MSDADQAQPPDTTAEGSDSTQCNCPNCSLEVVPGSKQKKKKPYLPPRPDEHTFETQQAFLDSLTPVSIDEVRDDDRKCAICWKPYGEAPDPGFDNTEVPVRLRCDHAFGDKCLKSTFAIPETISVHLRPLSFVESQKSRSLELGRRLHAYAMEHAKGSGDNFELFRGMLEKTEFRSSGLRILGRHWWEIINNLRSPTRDLKHVTFMENAVVLDTHMLKHDGPFVNSLPSQFLTLNSVNMDQTIYSVSMASTPMVINTPVPKSLSGTAQAPLSQSFPPALGVPTESSGGKQWPQTTGHSGPSNNSSGEASLSVWTEALATETNLDKLVALQKKAKANNPVPAIAPNEQTMADAKASEEAAKRLKRAQDLQDRRKRGVMKLLTNALVRVYTAYPKTEHGSAVDTEMVEAEIVQTPVTVHAGDLSRTCYHIEPPFLYTGLFDNSEDGLTIPKLDNTTFIVTRSLCSACCKVGREDATRLPLPGSLWWKDGRKVPDGCPICHKVLFKSEEMPPNITPWTELYMH